MGQPGRKYRWDDENRSILGRGKSQSAVATQMQRKQDENASLIKVPSHMAKQTRIMG